MVFTSVAQAQNDIEDPNVFEGVWYRIALDEAGAYVLGDGDGYAAGTWYHYDEPNQEGYWRQWFYNGPYDPNSKGQLDYVVYIKANDPTLRTSLEVRFNWSTPQWSALGKHRPPLPTDAATVELETEYMQSQELQIVDDWFIGTIEPIKTHTIDEYNPEWVSIDIRGKNVYVYRGANHSSLPKYSWMGACYDAATGDCHTVYETGCRAPYVWMGPGTSCSDYVTPVAFPVPVYRFWLPRQQKHMYSTSERERDSLRAESEKDCAFEGIAYCVLMDDADPDSLPVYKFWSDVLGAHFYTMSETEKEKLITQYRHAWTYEGPAFYAYSEDLRPADTVPVYRFWSSQAGYHFYTVSEAEKDDLLDNHPGTWVFEGIAWYAYQP
jgi:hypothetical protein